MKVNPWTAARARVWFRDGFWHYEVKNYKGRVVVHDMAGGVVGRNHIFTAAAKAVDHVRWADGIGQGKHFNKVEGWFPGISVEGSPSRDTWPGQYGDKPPFISKRIYWAAQKRRDDLRAAARYQVYVMVRR